MSPIAKQYVTKTEDFQKAVTNAAGERQPPAHNQGESNGN